jgi:hypothetical protein
VNLSFYIFQIVLLLGHTFFTISSPEADPNLVFSIFPPNCFTEFVEVIRKECTPIYSITYEESSVHKVSKRDSEADPEATLYYGNIPHTKTSSLHDRNMTIENKLEDTEDISSIITENSEDSNNNTKGGCRELSKISCHFVIDSVPFTRCKTFDEAPIHPFIHL